MTNNTLSIQEKTEGIVFKIFVQPRASKNAIVGLHGDALKIRLTAPPVDGAANKMCVKYLSKCLGIPKSSVEIVSGQTGRTKQVLVKCGEGKDAEAEKKEVKDLLSDLASE